MASSERSESKVRGRLIIALDVAEIETAQHLADLLDSHVEWFKIGFQLFFQPGGPAFVETLKSQGKRVFLDLKLHDIPNTITAAITALRRFEPDFLTVHAERTVVEAARNAVEALKLRTELLAVTVLTSITDEDVRQHGFSEPLELLVKNRARIAVDAGAHGLVASAREARMLKKEFPGIVLVTPGIRPADHRSDDQKRSRTPGDAIYAGADYLVIGRPVIQASDPVSVVCDLNRSIINAGL
ncbi:MAG: orotidine-5'-phosphate decarboxylase [Pseudomonadota bacterium]